MKRSTRVIVLLLTCVHCATARSAAAQAFSEARLQQACETLQRTPLATAELQTLLDVSRLATNSPALRSRSMAAYSISFLLRGNTNAFERAAQIHRQTFPGDPTLISVNRDAYLAVCADCEGTGLTTAVCPSCMGSGKCKSCAGSGHLKSSDGADTPCPSCKRSGTCPMCAGKKNIETPCPICKGTCRVIKLSEKVRANYLSLLTNMVAICQDDMDFSEQFNQAKNENDPAKRTLLLQALIQRFAHRADLKPARALLEKELKNSEAVAASRSKQREQEQAQREIEALRNLRDSKDTAPAIATLRAYLAGHPKSANQAEVQTLLDEMETQQARKQNLKKIAYGTGALVGLVLLVQLIKPLLLRKRRSGGTVKEIDKTRFSDPLTLTAKESKARVNNKDPEADDNPS